jgi:putative ABC transport system ATP-binding protein
MENKKKIIIEAKNIGKNFVVKALNVRVLTDVSIIVNQGDFLVLFGPSGCGKSTLLHILLGLEIPTSGHVNFFGQSLYNQMDEDMRTEFRKRHIGMVYQQPNWIKALTVAENINFALRLNGIKEFEAKIKSENILKQVGMYDWRDYMPMELSSGQQQKIALARAIVTNPDILIADEPTGNLDFESGQELMALLSKMNSEGKTVIMVTHDLEYLTYASRAVQMFDGKVVREIVNPKKFVVENKIGFKRIKNEK